MSELMTTQELAQELKFSARTIRQWAQQGRLPAIRIGGQLRFRRRDIESWLSNNQSSEPTVPEVERERPDRTEGTNPFSQEAWDKNWQDFIRRVKEIYERK